jgi:hypothetical protein
VEPRLRAIDMTESDGPIQPNLYELAQLVDDLCLSVP